MRVAVVLEHRFSQTPDGAVWSRASYPYNFWTRYLREFEHVLIVARCEQIPDAPTGWNRVDGPDVSFAVIPYYVGPAGFLGRLPRIHRAIHQAISSDDAVILRVGSLIGGLIQPTLVRRGQAYAVEVVGDPHEAFAPRATRHFLRPIFRRYLTRQLQRHCRQAAAAAYVTRAFLQRRYPASRDALSVSYSSVELPDQAFVSEPRGLTTSDRPFRLLTLSSLAQMYKGVDVLLDATSLCRRKGLDVRLTIAGDGKHRGELEQYARDLNLSDAVSFLGAIPAGDCVREQLDQADVFVLASRTEGLPRAIIEAMARGLPCIGSAVGGIPELLEPEDMVPPDDAQALAGKIAEVVTSPQRCHAMSVRNLKISRQFHNHVLSETRTAFYHHLRCTAEQRMSRTAA